VARYGNFSYASAKYGLQPRLAFSVEPMELVVLDFTKTRVEWQSPTGNFTKIRLVRNQSGFPETAEDGIVIWEEAATEGTVTRSTFVDSDDAEIVIPPITPGQQVYYRMFLFIDAGYWVVAGQITDTVPSDHNSQKRIMDIIPKVFTSQIQSPLGVTDENSSLYAFMEGMSFTYEQLLTQIDLLRPNHSFESGSFALLPIETLNFGLDLEPNLPVRNQKRLIREAIFMYTHKGLSDGIQTYAESLTGYAPTLTVSENLLLSVQDSTFYGSVGNWTATNATLSSSTEQVADTGDNVIDGTDTCKIIASSAGLMSLGNVLPITKGVPVTAGTEYIMSLKLKSPTSAGNITPRISYYDKNTTLLFSKAGTAVAANNTWKSASLITDAPAAQTAVLTGAVGSSGSIVYTTDDPHTYLVGSVVTITGFSTTAVNLSNVTITAVTSDTFTVANAYTGTATGTGAVKTLEAKYASLGISYSAAGTYYVDQVCVQAGDTVDYDEARAIDIFLDSSKVNYIKNPSFETNTNQWSITAASNTRVSVAPDDISGGTTSLNLSIASAATIATTTGSLPVLDKYYTLSFYAKGSTTSTGTVTLTPKDNGVALTAQVVSSAFTLSTNWQRFTVTTYVDAEDVDVALTATATIVFNSSSGATVWVDAVQLEASPFASDYYDGNLASQFGAVWEGTANESPTHLYPNKPFKIPRLAQTLDSWVPPNSFWRVRSFAGVEFTNLTV
jgi:hypothetical protein